MILAMARPEGAGGGNLFAALLPFLLMFVVLYFLLIRPQQKRQKQHTAILEKLQKGDRVITNSGIFGTIVNFNEKNKSVVLKVGDHDTSKIEVLRSSIAGTVDAGSGG
jgi:preprotein translocase subunit YajC